MKKQKFLLAGLLLSLSIAAQADLSGPKPVISKPILQPGLPTSPVIAQTGQDGNGGDTVTLPDGTHSILDLAEHDKIDYFTMDGSQYIYAGAPNRPEGVDEPLGAALWSDERRDGNGSNIMAHVSAVLTKANQDCMQNGENGLRWAWTDVSLEEINDEGLISIDSPVTKKQLAVQKDGLVLVNKKEFDQLDYTSKGVLHLHESLICAVKKENPYLIPRMGTAPIRQFVRAYVDIAYSTKPVFVLEDAFRALQIPEAYDAFLHLSSIGSQIYSYVSVPMRHEDGRPFVNIGNGTLDCSRQVYLDNYTIMYSELCEPRDQRDDAAAVATAKQYKAKALEAWKTFSKSNIDALQKAGKPIPSNLMYNDNNN